MILQERLLLLVALALITSGCAGTGYEAAPSATDSETYASPKAGYEEVSEGPILLRYEGRGSEVYVSGEFNNWSSSADPMREVEPGVFETEIELKSGTYRYMFIVDGSWITDPENPETVPDGRGGRNSVLRVR